MAEGCSPSLLSVPASEEALLRKHQERRHVSFAAGTPSDEDSNRAPFSAIGFCQTMTEGNQEFGGDVQESNCNNHASQWSRSESSGSPSPSPMADSMDLATSIMSGMYGRRFHLAYANYRPTDTRQSAISRNHASFRHRPETSKEESDTGHFRGSRVWKEAAEFCGLFSPSPAPVVKVGDGYRHGGHYITGGAERRRRRGPGLHLGRRVLEALFHEILGAFYPLFGDCGRQWAQEV